MPNFVYETNIPAASHNPSADQPIMQTNANSINSIIGIDHFSFNATDGGYHKQVSLVNEATPALPAGVGCMLLSAANNLVFANAQIPAGVFLTQSNTPPVVTTKGSTFLPGAIVMQWGQGNTVAGVFNDTLIYSLSSVFCAFACAVSDGSIIADILVISPNVAVQCRTFTGALAPATPVYWLVIGII